MSLFGGDLFNGDDVAAVALVGGEHLAHAAPAQHVGQQHREGLVADDLAGAPHRVAEAEGGLLPGEARLPRLRQVLLQLVVGRLFAAFDEGLVELVGDVEVVLDHGLAAAGDEDEVFDPGLTGFVDDVLDDGASTTVNISFGTALVAGRKRVPSPRRGGRPCGSVSSWAALEHQELKTGPDDETDRCGRRKTQCMILTSSPP